MKTLKLALLLLAFATLPVSAAASPVAAAEGYVRAYLDLVAQRSAKPLDLGRIRKSYEALVPMLREADRLTRGLRAETDAYLARAETAAVKGPSLQGVEKTIQLAFVVFIKKNLDAAATHRSNPPRALDDLRLVRALYGGLENTFKRRGNELGSVNLLHDQMVLALDYLEQAAKSRDANGLAQGRRAVDELLVRVYVLSVLYELDGIAANRGKDEVVTAEKQVEGRIFFRIVRTIDKDMKYSAEIEAELAKAPSEMDLRMAREWLAAAFPQLAKEYKERF